MREAIIAAAAVAALAVLSACGGQSAEGGDATEEADAPAQTVSAGQQVYRTYCLSCHQASGNGVPSMYPPLTESDWVQGDKGRLIRLVLNGMTGEIEVKGEVYNNVMTPHGFLSDQQLADVITFVRQNFGNDASAVTVDEVAAVRGGIEQEGMWEASTLEERTGIPGAE